MTAEISANQKQPRRTRWGNLVAALSVVATILVCVWLPGMLVQTLPVFWFFFASFVAWAVLRRGRNPWAKAGGAILGPVTWGLLAVVIVLMVFGNATTEADMASVKSIERAMLWLNAHRLPDLKDWPVTTLAVLLLLTSLCYLQPRWKIVQRSQWLKDGLTQISATIAVAASFTFFAQAYVVAPYAESVYRRLTAVLRNSRHAEVEHALSRVCAEELTKSVKALPAPARNFYRQILQTLAAWDQARAREMLSDFIEFHERAGAPHEPASLHPATGGKPRGEALPSPVEIADALAVQKTREVAEERKRRAAEQEMNAAVGEVLGIGNEHWSDLISGFAEKLLEPYIGENSKILSKAVSEYLSGVTEESLDQYQEEWRERQAEQLTKRVQEMVDGKSDAVAELVKPEMEKLVDLTKRVAQLAYVEKAEMSTPGASSPQESSKPGSRSPDGHIGVTVRPPQRRGPVLIEKLRRSPRSDWITSRRAGRIGGYRWFNHGGGFRCRRQSLRRGGNQKGTSANRQGQRCHRVRDLLTEAIFARMLESAGTTGAIQLRSVARELPQIPEEAMEAGLIRESSSRYIADAVSTAAWRHAPGSE